MTFSRMTRTVLLVLSGLVLLFIYAPLALVVLNSFNTSRTFEWPPPGYTTQWWAAAVENPGARNAIVVSVEVALMAPAVALVLGTMTALALHRFRFFGRDTVSLLIVLPIALRGVVTGIALANAFLTMFGIQLGLFSLVVSHATFCVVTVFNNAIARLRRLGGNLEEASMDLGAGTFRTFWSVMVRTRVTAAVALPRSASAWSSRASARGTAPSRASTWSPPRSRAARTSRGPGTGRRMRPLLPVGALPTGRQRPTRRCRPASATTRWG